MSLHPQVAALLDKAASSPLPTLDAVTPFVARRLYRERCAVVTPEPPTVTDTRIFLVEGRIVVRCHRPAGHMRDDVLPALVYFHGGGWTIGDLDTHDVLCRQLANGAHCAVFSVEYRLAPESPFPAAVDDCVAATRFVLEEASSLRIDARRVAVGGDSAGGNLATVVALQLPGLVFQLLIYPATDMRAGHASHRRNGEGYLLTSKLIEYFRGHYIPRRADWSDWRASPLLAPSLAGLPPAYLLTAGYDPLADEGREYAERLAREGVEVSCQDYPDMIHGFIVMGRVIDRANEAVAKCAAALRGAFKKVTA